MVTDENGDPQSHIGENLQLKTPSELINGAVGNFSIKIDSLKPNTAYENMYSIRWYNPGTQLFSEYVDVPRFKTLMIKPVDIDSNKVTVEPYPDHVVIKDGTTRDLQVEEATLKAYKVSDGSIVASSSNNTISIPDLAMTTEYTDQYGIYWENSKGTSNKLTLDFTTTTAKPVDIDPNKINIEVLSGTGIRVKDLTPREYTSKTLTLHAYEVETGKVIWNSVRDDILTVYVYSLTPGTTYTNKYGLYWTNAGGESNKVPFTFTTKSE